MKRRTNYITEILLRRWAVIVGLAALGTFVLVLFLGRGQSIWFDESYSVLLAKQSVLDIFRLTGVDAHPPLYYLLLKLWCGLFGWSELALRSLSALLSALTVGVAALLLRRLFSVKVVLVSLPFLVFAPYWLRYGYEIRMYALAGLIGALASWALLRAVDTKTDRRRWAVYALLVAAGMYTLYVTAVIWLAHFVWLLSQDRRRIIRQPWFLAYVAAAALFLPYVLTVFYQFSNSPLSGVGQIFNMTHLGELVSMLLIYTPEWSVGKWSTAGIILFMGLIVYLLDRVYHRTTSSTRRSLSFLVCMTVVPFVFFVTISLAISGVFFLPRYLAQASLYAYMLIGVVITLGWSYGFRRAASSLFVIACLLLSWGVGQLIIAGNFNYERMQRPETASVRQLVDCKKSVVVADDAYTYINDLYYFDGCDFRFYSTLPIPFRGGYAWLADNGIRLANSRDLNAGRVVHLYWQGTQKNFQIDNRYRLVSSITYDHQVTDTYEFIEE